MQILKNISKQILIRRYNLLEQSFQLPDPLLNFQMNINWMTRVYWAQEVMQKLDWQLIKRQAYKLQ